MNKRWNAAGFARIPYLDTISRRSKVLSGGLLVASLAAAASLDSSVWGRAGSQLWFSSQRSASMAAMQPDPAAVIA